MMKWFQPKIIDYSGKAPLRLGKMQQRYKQKNL